MEAGTTTNSSSSSSSLLESMIPDAMLLLMASYLDGDDLMSFELVSKKFRSLPGLDTKVWQSLCHNKWTDWPRYRWEHLRKSHPRLVGKTWKQRYLWVSKDFRRTTMTTDELESACWYFNYTPQAGGLGSETLTRCFFRSGIMAVQGFPPLPCRLVFNDETNRQELKVYNFPHHSIARLEHNGEWIMTNENVTVVSAHETDVTANILNYHGRGFQG